MPKGLIEPWHDPEETGGWRKCDEGVATIWAFIPDNSAAPFEYFESRAEAEAYAEEEEE